MKTVRPKGAGRGKKPRSKKVTLATLDSKISAVLEVVLAPASEREAEFRAVFAALMESFKGMPTDRRVEILKQHLMADMISRYELMRDPTFMETFVAVRQAWDRT